MTTADAHSPAPALDTDGLQGIAGPALVLLRAPRLPAGWAAGKGEPSNRVCRVAIPEFLR